LYEYLPLALQYGMTKEEFWYGDIELFSVYQKAYYIKVSYESWLFGLRNFEAYSKALSNSNRTKETDAIAIYDDWKNPIEKTIIPKMEKEELNKKFKTEQKLQNNWLFRK
jgi:hypothetical protein